MSLTPRPHPGQYNTPYVEYAERFNSYDHAYHWGQLGYAPVELSVGVFVLRNASGNYIHDIFKWMEHDKRVAILYKKSLTRSAKGLHRFPDFINDDGMHVIDTIPLNDQTEIEP